MKRIIFVLAICLANTFIFAQEYKTPQVDWSDTSIYYNDEFNKMVINNIDWCYNTPITTLKNTRKEVISFLMQWMGHHPYINVSTHADIIKCNNNTLLSMFLLGRAKYNMEHTDIVEKNSILAGADFMLNFYDKNAETFGKNKQVKKLKKLIANGKWEKKLAKQTA